MGRSKMMTQASDTQVGGNHYKDFGQFQPWDVLQHWLTPEEYRGYQKGVAIAYLARERQKGGDQDIAKAAHHLRKLTEVLAQTPAVPHVPSFLQLTDEGVDAVIKSMPNGLGGFLKSWGFHQFANAVLEKMQPATLVAKEPAEAAVAVEACCGHPNTCETPCFHRKAEPPKADVTMCCGEFQTCTTPCVPRAQSKARSDGWILHDGTTPCPVPAGTKV